MTCSTFFNDDSVPHNIMSASKGNEFNLGSQAPGSSTDVTFKEARRCACDLCDPSAHEDDGEGDGLAQNLRHLPPMQATGDF